MGSFQQSYSLIDNKASSGSELLDSFYDPPPAVTCLRDYPVVDMSQILRAASNAAPSLHREKDYAEKDCSVLVTTPRETAIMRLNRVLKLDRVSDAQAATVGTASSR